MELFSESTRRDPYALYAQLREATPVLHLAVQDLWVVFRYHSVKRVLHDTASFSSDVSPARGERFEWLLFMDPPRHTELRAIVSRAFTSRSIAALEDRIRALSRRLLDAAGDEFDLVGAYATPLPMMVIAEMVGLPVEEWQTYARWSDAIVGLGNTITGEGAERASTMFDDVGREMREVRARGAPRRDAQLARLADAGLSRDEALRRVPLLPSARPSASSNTISNATLG